MQIQGPIGANTAGGMRNPFGAMATLGAQRRRARRATKPQMPAAAPAAPPAAGPALGGVTPGTNPFSAAATQQARARLARRR